MGRWGDGEMGRWGDWEMGRLGDGEIGRWGDWVWELEEFLLAYSFSTVLTQDQDH
ncbi:MAG: hypothetical protein F6K23_13990 [Okeania sp. SIO2C9]|uniref:hypothetical protein n=1 Tax=Okeania sp. SIO2C9 TaxID=2607791 RepID=UPI0013C141EE|nr:hypothetical protein [Okeania sp. SIO2C9]